MRKELNIKSVRMKIEKRSLERMGHMVRMFENRMTKKVVFGWTKMTEKEEGNLKRTKNTPEYWLKLTKEAGWDQISLEHHRKDRTLWRSMVKERMKHTEDWETNQENGGRRETRQIQRTQYEKDEACICRVCGKKRKSRAGVAIHTKRMHRESINYNCNNCDRVFTQSVTLKNHLKACVG